MGKPFIIHDKFKFDRQVTECKLRQIELNAVDSFLAKSPLLVVNPFGAFGTRADTPQQGDIITYR